jgi:hypothetical protein
MDTEKKKTEGQQEMEAEDALQQSRNLFLKNLYSSNQLHLLQTDWSFWYYVRNPDFQTPGTYREQLKNIGTVNSLEHFYHYYAFLKRPQEMAREADIHFFRGGEVPMWEVNSLH